MVTEYEAQKLQREMTRELGARSGDVLKCVVGLVIVFGLAAIGSGLDLRQDRSVNATQASVAQAQ